MVFDCIILSEINSIIIWHQHHHTHIYIIICVISKFNASAFDMIFDIILFIKHTLAHIYKVYSCIRIKSLKSIRTQNENGKEKKKKKKCGKLKRLFLSWTDYELLQIKLFKSANRIPLKCLANNFGKICKEQKKNSFSNSFGCGIVWGF